MENRLKHLGMWIVLAVFVLGAPACAALYEAGTPPGEVPRMSKEELKSRLGDPSLVIIDVRIERSYEASERKIQGAVREELADVAAWSQRYDPKKTLVLYCD